MIIKIAVRNIFRHRARSIITLATIIFGCIALIFVGGFFEDIFYQMRESYINAQTGHLQVYKKGFTKNGRTDPYSYLIDNASEVKALVQKLPEVESLTSRIQFGGLISTGENTISFIGQGVEPEFERTITKEDTKDLRRLYQNKHDNGLPVIEEGVGLDKTQPYGVILGKGLAQSMDIKMGGPITVLTNTVNGSTNALDLNARGIFYTSSKNFDDLFLRMPLSTAQKLLNTQFVQSLIIKLHRTEDTEKVKIQLLRLFEQKHLDLEVKTWEELSDFYTKTVDLFHTFYFIVRIVIMVVVILSIFNTMNMAVMERISEIGTIMALGARRQGVLKLFLLEGLVLGLIGGILGIIIGSGVVSMIGCVGIPMPPPPNTTLTWLAHPKIVPHVVCYTFFICILMGGISSFYPALKASRLVITDALRYR